MTVQQRGLTLLELVIAMAIFATAVSLSMQAFIAMKNYTYMENNRTGMRQEGRELLAIIRNDLSNSAWFLPSISDPKGSLSLTVTSDETSSKQELSDTSVDRALRYYPYINSQTSAGSGTRFTAFKNIIARDFDTKSVLDSRSSEFMLPSREIIFLKVARGDHVDTPAQIINQRINFNDPALSFEDWPEPEPVPFLEMQIEDGVISDATLAFEQNTSGDLREYSYQVYEGSFKNKEFWRVYYHRPDGDDDGDDSTLVQEKILSYNVDRVVFNTYRTMAGLSVDQVHVTLYMSVQNISTGQFISHIAQSTFGMRSTVDPEYSESIDEWLGTGGNFLVE